MSESDPAQLTHAQLLEARAEQRVALVEAFLLASARALRQGASGDIDTATHLADLAIDSIQIVDLKFGIDQLLGREIDVELFITNPSIAQLAVSSLRAAGLLPAANADS